jgi:hypothetical protein
MIEQMEKDVFYSTLCKLLQVYVSDNSHNSAMASLHKQWRDYWCDKRQTEVWYLPDSLETACISKLFIAPLECVPAFFCLLHDSKFHIRQVGCSGRQLAASSYLATILILSPK